MNINRQIKTERSWLLIVFGSFFALPALLILLLSIVPSIYESVQMSAWATTQATLDFADVSTHRQRNDDGNYVTTYKAEARYHYRVDGIKYKNDRVQISSGSDNVGDFQEKFGGDLKRKYKRKKPVTVYYNFDNPADSVLYPELRWGMLGLKSLMVVIFGGAGFGIMFFGWRGKKTNLSPETLEQPWLKNPRWMENRILSDSKPVFYVSIIFAIIWNLMTLPVLFTIGDVYKEKGLMILLIVLLFPAVGLGLAYWAFSSWKRWKKYGRAPLILSPFPGNIDGVVGGKIQFKQALTDHHQYIVTLNLVRSVTTGSGKHRRTEEKLIWQKEGIATLKQVLINDIRSELAFLFKTPAELPESDIDADGLYGRHIWRVNIVNKEIELDRSFEIPVFNSNNIRTAKTKQAGNYSNTEYSSFLDKGEAQSDIKIKIEDYIPFLDTPAHAVAGLSNQTVIHYPLFRKLASDGLFALVGSIFFSIGVFLWFEDDAPAIMSIGFCFLGGLLALGGFYGLINTLTVTLANNRLDVKKTLLGIPTNSHSFNYSEIKDVIAKESYRASSGGKHSTHYKILAVPYNGKKVKIAEAVNGTAKKIVVDYFKEKLRLK